MSDLKCCSFQKEEREKPAKRTIDFCNGRVELCLRFLWICAWYLCKSLFTWCIRLFFFDGEPSLHSPSLGFVRAFQQKSASWSKWQTMSKKTRRTKRERKKTDTQTNKRNAAKYSIMWFWIVRNLFLIGSIANYITSHRNGAVDE